MQLMEMYRYIFKNNRFNEMEAIYRFIYAHGSELRLSEPYIRSFKIRWTVNYLNFILFNMELTLVIIHNLSRNKSV